MFALYLGIRQYLVEARYIPSGSMLPGLQVGDEHLFFDLAEFMHLIERLIISAEARRLDYLNTSLNKA